jgi:formyl-CoA transferase
MQRTKIEAMEELCREGIPAGANLNTEDLTNDPYLRKRGIIAEIHHPQRGSVWIPTHPMKMEGTVPVTTSPLLGEHNLEIYNRLLGLSEEEMQTLTKKEVI